MTGTTDRARRSVPGPRTTHPRPEPPPGDRPLGFAFWSPSAIENFRAAHGFELAPGPVVLIGGSTLRCWSEVAPAPWRRAFRHDAETPLEWSLRFLERDPESTNS